MAIIDQLKLLFTPQLTEAQILTVYHRVNFDLEEAVLQLSLQLDQLDLTGGNNNIIPPVKKDRGPLTKLDSDQCKKDLDLLQGMFSEKAIKELQQLYNKFKGNVDEVVQYVLNQPQDHSTIRKSNTKQAKKVNQAKVNNSTPKNAATTTKPIKQAKNGSKNNRQKSVANNSRAEPQTFSLDPTAYPIFACTKSEKQPVKKKTSSKFNWDRQCYLQWSHVQWEELNTTLNQVKSIFPNLSNFTMIHSFLKNDGDLSETLEWCCQTCEYIQREGISDTDHAYNIELESSCDNLLDMFPTFTRFQIVLILMICQNNMDAALQSLLDMQYIIQSNISMLSQSTSAKKKPTFVPAPNLLNAKFNHRANILDLQVTGSSHKALNKDAVQSLRHSSRELLDDPDIYRERAQDYYDKRNDLYEKAVTRHKHRAKRNNHAGVAFYYAEEGRELDRKAQFQNELAVRSLITEKLSNRSDPYEVDLHGFRVQEAIDFALEQTSIWYIRDMKRVEAGRHRKLHPLTFVTGKGVHNADGKSRIMPPLVRKLREEGWKVEPNTGYLRVLGTSDTSKS